VQHKAAGAQKNWGGKNNFSSQLLHFER